MAKGKAKPKRNRLWAVRVGTCVRVATQYDGVRVCEVIEIDEHIYVVRAADGKVYRVLSSEIL